MEGMRAGLRSNVCTRARHGKTRQVLWLRRHVVVPLQFAEPQYEYEKLESREGLWSIDKSFMTLLTLTTACQLTKGDEGQARSGPAPVLFERFHNENPPESLKRKRNCLL